MRIAAGVLLIIASIGSVFGGLKYGAVGGAGAVAADEAKAKGATADDIKKAVDDAKANQNVTMTAAGEEAAKIAQLALEKGSMIAAFGMFLFVMFGLQIAAAVTLFMQKAPKFIMVVAVLGIISELIGPLMFSPLGSFGFWAIIGIVASVLALLSARSFGSGGAAA